MKKIYLVTGASGHLGSTIISILLSEGKSVRALVLPGEEKYVPEGVEIFTGDVTDKGSMEPFFEHGDDEELILIHCAGIVTIASKENPLVSRVNVDGTHNVLELARENKVRKVVHVSSVHALIEAEEGETKEAEEFYPDMIEDQYGKSKARATIDALKFAQEGLDVSIVHPSGIFGPGDKRKNNHMIRAIELMAKGLIPVSLSGGFDFVDVRDAAEGILKCAERGKKGECYILSGHYISVKELLEGVNEIRGKRTPDITVPYGLVAFFAPAMEKLGTMFGNGKPLVTPYSIAILNTNGHFSHEKATTELGYTVRDVRTTLKDMIAEL